MFQVIKTIDGVSGFFDFDEDYFYCFHSGFFTVYEKKSFEIIWKEGFKFFTWIYISDKEVIISGRKEKGDEYFFFEKKAGERILKKLPYNTIGLLGVLNNKILYETYLDETYLNKKIGVLDGDSILWEKESSHNFIIFKDKVLGAPFSSNTLEEISFEDGKMKWKIQGEDNKIMPKILEISDGFLYVIFHENVIKQIDIKTKETLNEWKEIPKEYDWLTSIYSQIPGLEGAEYIYDDNKISCLHQYYYSEIDLNSNQVKCYDLSKDFKEEEVKTVLSGSFSYSGDFIFFFSDYYKKGKNGIYTHVYKLVVFNHKTREIKWTYDMKFPDGVRFGQSEPIVDGDFIYLRDSQGQLLIFKRDMLSNKINLTSI